MGFKTPLQRNMLLKSTMQLGLRWVFCCFCRVFMQVYLKNPGFFGYVPGYPNPVTHTCSVLYKQLLRKITNVYLLTKVNVHLKNHNKTSEMLKPSPDLVECADIRPYELLSKPCSDTACYSSRLLCTVNTASSEH